MIPPPAASRPFLPPFSFFFLKKEKEEENLPMRFLDQAHAVVGDLDPTFL
jgi:hypothetical protein